MKATIRSNPIAIAVACVVIALALVNTGKTQNAERVYKIELTSSEINILGIALDELPSRLRERMTGRIGAQVQQQNADYDARAAKEAEGKK